MIYAIVLFAVTYVLMLAFGKYRTYIMSTEQQEKPYISIHRSQYVV